MEFERGLEARGYVWIDQVFFFLDTFGSRE
jgi:hypothetical protein